MAKKVDLKELMLEKGERIGLGVAAALMAIMVIIAAVGGFSRESPADTVAEIQGNANKIEEKLRLDPPLSPTEVDKGTLVPVATDLLNPKDSQFNTDLSIGEPSNDNKRRNPDVPVPDEFAAQLVRAQVENYIITGQGDKIRIGILVPKDKPGDKDKPTAVNPQGFQGRFTTPAVANPARPGYTTDAYGQLQRITQDESGASSDKYKLVFVDIKDKEVANAKPARTVHPLRMVIVTAAFPYKKELEAYARALKGPTGTIKELIGTRDLPAFESCLVRRRIIPTIGKPGPWEEVKLDEHYRPVLQMSIGTQKEDKKLNGVIFPKSPLVMYLPTLARGEYPAITLKNVKKAADELAAKAASGEPPPVIAPLEAKLKGKDFDIYNPVAGVETKPDDYKGPREARAGEDAAIPEYCLIRLVDADPKLKSNATYQYQIKVRLTNPNYGQKDKVAFEDLASKPVIESEWAPDEKEIKAKGTEVTIPREMYYYATEVNDKIRTIKEKSDPKLISDRADVAYLQAQQWFEAIQLNPSNAASKVPLGDWAITEIPVRRGEYIARRENVMVPIWVPTREGFEFAIPVLERRPAGSRPAPGIPVDFGPREPANLELLVDYEGGRVEQSFKVGDKPPKNVREEAPLEILVMSPDGTLRVQNSRQDAKDSAREARTANIEKFLDDVSRKSKVGGSKDPLAPK